MLSNTWPDFLKPEPRVTRARHLDLNTEIAKEKRATRMVRIARLFLYVIETLQRYNIIGLWTLFALGNGELHLLSLR